MEIKRKAGDKLIQYEGAVMQLWIELVMPSANIWYGCIWRYLLDGTPIPSKTYGPYPDEVRAKLEIYQDNRYLRAIASPEK